MNTDFEQEAVELFEYAKQQDSTVRTPGNPSKAIQWANRANYVAALYSFDHCGSNTSGEHNFSTATVLLLACKLEEHYREQQTEARMILQSEEHVAKNYSKDAPSTNSTDMHLL